MFLLLKQPSRFLPQRLHTVLTTHRLINLNTHNRHQNHWDQLHPSLGNTSPQWTVAMPSPPFSFHFPSRLEQNTFFQKRLSSDSPSASSHTHLPIHNYSHELPLSPLSQLHTSQFSSHLPLNHTPLKIFQQQSTQWLHQERKSCKLFLQVWKMLNWFKLTSFQLLPR